MILSSSTLSFSRKHETDDIHLLALQANLYPDVDIQAAVVQIKGLQIAKEKLPSWYHNLKIIYPKHLSLEQCSSEQTALYKQQLCELGTVMVDLTGGLGVDTSFLSKAFSEVIYVEQQLELCELAERNLKALDLENIQVVHSDAVEYLKTLEEVDLIYIDPARRDTKGRKTVFIEDCTPNLLDIEDLLIEKAKSVMIKLSPMLDISLALSKLKGISEVHVVSVDNECKELLFIRNKQFNKALHLHCINIRKNVIDKFIFTHEEEDQSVPQYTSDIKTYLYEPNASIMKAGAYKAIARYFSIEKLHVSSHLYTSDSNLHSFPGRKFKVIATSSLNKKELKVNLQNIDKANITIRNFPMKVDDLRKKLKLNDGGNIYIFATTLFNNQKVLIICEKSEN